MERRRIRFGTFLAPFHSVHENPTLALDRDLELVGHLDRLGFDEVWVGEHHSGGMEIVASPEIFIAAARRAHEADRARHGRRVAPLPPSLPGRRADQPARPPDQRADDVRRGRRRAALRRRHAGDRRIPDPRHDDGSARRHRTVARRRDGQLQDRLVRSPRGPSPARPLHPAAGRTRRAFGGIAVRPSRSRQVRHEPAVDRRHHPGRVRSPAGNVENLRRRSRSLRQDRRQIRMAAGRARPRRGKPASRRAPMSASESRNGCIISPMSPICRSTRPAKAMWKRTSMR